MFFCLVRFDITNFHFNSCFRLQFVCLMFSTNSVVGIKLLNLVFKISCNCRNMLFVFNKFLWNIFVVSFSTLVYYERCSVSDLKFNANNRVGGKIKQKNCNLKQLLKWKLVISNLTTQKTPTHFIWKYQPSNQKINCILNSDLPPSKYDKMCV